MDVTGISAAEHGIATKMADAENLGGPPDGETPNCPVRLIQELGPSHRNDSIVGSRRARHHHCEGDSAMTKRRRSDKGEVARPSRPRAKRTTRAGTLRILRRSEP